MKKIWQIYNTFLIVCLFISVFFIFTFFPVKTYINEGDCQPKTSSSGSGWSGGIILEYNEFYAPHGDGSKKIDWWFISFPYNISLIVMILDTYYFTEFLGIERSHGLNATIFDFYFESFIVEYSNNGTGEMELYYEDHWYVIFINLDNDMEASQLEFRVNFDVYEEKYFYINPIAIVYTIYGVFISLIIIVLIVRAIRKRVIMNRPASIPPYPYLPKKESPPTNIPPKQESIQSVESEFPVAKYCPFCGEYIDRDAIFCHQCGNKL